MNTQTDGWQNAKQEEWLPRLMQHTPSSQNASTLSKRGAEPSSKAVQRNHTKSECKINYENISVSLFVNFPWPWDASAGFVLALPHAFALVFLMSV